ncbi:MAG: SCP2 sterol-binding domain-containing protein, partial [Bacteroidota bacterium]
GGSSEIMREIIAKMLIDDVSYNITSNEGSHKSGQHGTKKLANVFEQIKEKATSAASLGNTLKFDFGDEQLYIDGTGEQNEVSLEDKEAACLVESSFEDFLALTRGDLNPMNAVMSGKVKIKGDMSVAMKLQSLFG